MKKTLLLKSACAAAILAVSAGGVFAASGNGDVYNIYNQPSQDLRGTPGATSPSAPAYTGSPVYDTYRMPSQALRGAMGPIRTDEAIKDDSGWKELQQRSFVLGGGNG